MADIRIDVIKRLKILLEVDEAVLAEVFGDYAVVKINEDLASQGMDLRVTRSDLKIQLNANTYGDVQGAQAMVDKELE